MTTPFTATEQAQDEHAFWKKVREDYGDREAIRLYGEAFPDESEFYSNIMKEHGVSNAIDVLLGSLVSPFPVGGEPAEYQEIEVIEEPTAPVREPVGEQVISEQAISEVPTEAPEEPGFFGKMFGSIGEQALSEAAAMNAAGQVMADANAAFGRKRESWLRGNVVAQRKLYGKLPSPLSVASLIHGISGEKLKSLEGIYQLSDTVTQPMRLPRDKKSDTEILFDLYSTGKIPPPEVMIEAFGEEEGLMLLDNMNKISPRLVSPKASWYYRGEVHNILPMSLIEKHPRIAGAIDQALLTGTDIIGDQLTDPREWVLDFVAGKWLVAPGLAILKAKGLTKLPVSAIVRRSSKSSKALRKALSTELTDIGTSKKVIGALGELTDDELRVLVDAVQGGKEVSIQLPTEVLPRDYVKFPKAKKWKMVEPEVPTVDVPTPDEFRLYVEPDLPQAATGITYYDEAGETTIIPDKLSMTGYTEQDIEFMQAMGMDDDAILAKSIEEFGDMSIPPVQYSVGDTVTIFEKGVGAKVLNPNDGGKVLVQLDNGLKMKVEPQQLQLGEIPPPSKAEMIKPPKVIEEGDFVQFRESPSSGLLEVVDNKGKTVLANTETGKEVEVPAKAIATVSPKKQRALDELRKQYSVEVGENVKRKSEAGFFRLSRRGAKQAVQLSDFPSKKRVMEASKLATGSEEPGNALYASRELSRSFIELKDFFARIASGARKVILARQEQDLLDLAKSKKYGDIISPRIRQLSDRMRTDMGTIGSRAHSQSAIDYHNMVWGDLDKYQREDLINLIYVKSAASRSAMGQKTFLKVKDPQQIDDFFQQLYKSAEPDTQRAFVRYENFQKAFGVDNLVRPGHLPIDKLQDEVYAPHHVVDYMFRDHKLGTWRMPRRLRKAFRGYTKQARGSERMLAIDEESLVNHNAIVYGDNELDNFAMRELVQMEDAVKQEMAKTLSPDQIKQVMKEIQANPNARIDVGDHSFVGYQYEPGRHIYPAVTADVEKIAESIADAMLTPESEINRIFRLPPDQQMDALLRYTQDIGPQGGDALRRGLALGRYKRVYLVPDEIKARFTSLRQPSEYIPLLQDAMAITSFWKQFAITWGGLPYHATNLFGDTVNMELTAPGAIGHMDHGFRIMGALDEITKLPSTGLGQYDLSQLGKIKHLGATYELTSHEKEVLDIVLKQGVLDSGFLRELRGSSPLIDVKGLWGRYQKWSSYRETLNRVVMADYQWNRYKTKGNFWAMQMDKAIQGLEPEQAVGYIARNALIDYADVPVWYKRYMRGVLFPFITFSQKNVVNMASLVKAMPGHPKEAAALLGEVAIPLSIVQAWNQADPMRRQAYARIGEYYGGQWLTTVLKTYDDNDDNNPDRALIWSPRTPLDEAGEWIGVRKLVSLAKATQMKDANGKPLLTVEEAAKRYASEVIEAPLAELDQLKAPIMQIIEGIKTNRDPFYKTPVVDPDKKNLPEYAKLQDYASYIVEKMSTATAQFARTGTKHATLSTGRGFTAEAIHKGTSKVGSEELTKYVDRITNVAQKGPFDWQRALGFRMIDLRQQTLREIRDNTLEMQGWEKYYKGKLHDEFIESGMWPEDFRDSIISGSNSELVEVVKDAFGKGVDLTEGDYLLGGSKDPGSLVSRMYQPHIWADIFKIGINEGVNPITKEDLSRSEIIDWTTTLRKLEYESYLLESLPSEQRPSFSETARKIMILLGRE
jgi:hypothetical protein